MSALDSKPKFLLVLALSLIAGLFMSVAAVTYHQFGRAVLTNEMVSQQKMTRIVNQSISRYFESLRLLNENAVLNKAFNPEKSISRRCDSL